MPTPEALPPSAQKFSRRRLLTVASSAAFLAACGGGTETGKGPGSPLTPVERGTLPPGVATAEGFPTYEISTSTPYPSATNPESDKDATGFPTVEETATPIETSTIESEWKSYTFSSRSNGYTIQYPKDWDKTGNTEGEKAYEKFTKETVNNRDTEVAVRVERVEDDLNNYSESVLSVFRDDAESYLDIKIDAKSTKETFLGFSALKIEIVAPAGGKNPSEFKLIGYIFTTSLPKGDYGWQVIYSADASVFDENLDAFYEMANSLQIQGDNIN